MPESTTMVHESTTSAFAMPIDESIIDVALAPRVGEPGAQDPDLSPVLDEKPY